MTDRDDIDMLAAEYVLGTLEEGERASVAARLRNETDLQAAVAEWEARLAPLASDVRPVAPRGDLFAEISRRLDQRGRPGGAEIVRLQARLRVWRAGAIAASIAAVLFAGLLAADRLGPGSDAQRYVAVFNEGDRQPSFVLSIDLATRELTIRPITAEARPENSYELWIVADELGPQPRSLGLLETAQVPTRKVLAEIQPAVLERATFGISLEPKGGSPVGRPTGPALHGRLIPATD